MGLRLAAGIPIPTPERLRSLVVLPEHTVEHLMAEGEGAVVVDSRGLINVHETHWLAVALPKDREPAGAIEAAPDADARAAITDWPFVLPADARKLGSAMNPSDLYTHRREAERRAHRLRMSAGR